MKIAQSSAGNSKRSDASEQSTISPSPPRIRADDQSAIGRHSICVKAPWWRETRSLNHPASLRTMRQNTTPAPTARSSALRVACAHQFSSRCFSWRKAVVVQCSRNCRYNDSIIGFPFPGAKIQFPRHPIFMFPPEKIAARRMRGIIHH